MNKKILLKTYKNFNFIDFATPIIDRICPPCLGYEVSKTGRSAFQAKLGRAVL